MFITMKTARKIKEESSDDTPISIEDIQELAPILPPETVEKLVDDNLEQQPKEKLDLSAIMGLVPFLDEEYLDTLVKRIDIDSLHELSGLAPFLSEETLCTLVLNADIESDMSGITSLAPFLDKNTLEKLVEKLLKK